MVSRELASQNTTSHMHGAPRSSGAEFERLYLESYGMVYGYVRARMGNDADAEDIVAEAFLKAARSFSSFDPLRARFSTWVVAIAKNCMVSYFRKEKQIANLEDVPESTFAVAGGQDAVDDQDLAYRLLACLDDVEHELVVMKYRDGMRNIDIAYELGMNASTVSTKLSNALAKMRRAAQHFN